MSAKKMLAREREERRKRRSAARAARKQQARVAAAAAGRRSVLRLPEVEVMSGLGRSSIQEQVEAGRFPRPVPLGGRAVGWLEEEVEGWIQKRIAERDRAA